MRSVLRRHQLPWGSLVGHRSNQVCTFPLRELHRHQQQRHLPSAGATLTPRAAFRALRFEMRPGESRESSSKRIKRCFIEQTLQCHPDLFPHDASATEAFQQLSEALRVALAYHAASGALPPDENCDEAAATSGANALVTLQQAVDDVLSVAPHGGGPSRATLEDVAEVCRAQTISNARIRTFCEELPTTLCGPQCPLFEVFCFHPARRTSEMEPFILRVSKELPVMVRRVVKRRAKVVHAVHKHSVSGGAAYGMASGDGARAKTIDDMIMKPLVLVGALLLAPTREAAASANLAGVARKGDRPDDAHMVAAGRPQVTCGEDITCSPELRCVLCATDSLDDIVVKLSAWEAASYKRLLVELAVGNALALLSAELQLVPTRSALVIQHDLEVSFERAQRVGFTVQHLLSQACIVAHEIDDGPGAQPPHTAAPLVGVVREVHTLMHEIDPDAIRGGIHLLMPPKDLDGDFLIQEHCDVLDGVPDLAHPCGADGKKLPAAFKVSRHPSACEATDVAFSVTLMLQRNALSFFSALRDALKEVRQQYDASLEVLPSLVDVRHMVQTVEWVALNKVEGRDSLVVDDTSASDADVDGCSASSLRVDPPCSGTLLWETPLQPTTPEDFASCSLGDGCSPGMRVLDAPIHPHSATPQFRMRQSIRCVARVFNMRAGEEKLLWDRIFEHREYFAAHQAMLGAWNVYYECSPYDPQQAPPRASEAADPEWSSGGWCGAGRDGTELLLVTKNDLESSDNFFLWLQDAVEQATLSRECVRLMKHHRIAYVERHPSLPLSYFLSFLTLFTSPAGTAARSLMETQRGSTRAAAGAFKPSQEVSAKHTGFTLVVTSGLCDIKNGGKLHVPWSIDPSQLVAALSDGFGAPRGMIEE